MKVNQTTALVAVSVSPAKAMAEAGFLPGMQVPVFFNTPAGSFVGSAILQSSVDNVTWVTATGATAVTTLGGIQNITLQQFMRLNCTAFTSGSIQATILSDIG